MLQSVYVHLHSLESHPRMEKNYKNRPHKLKEPIIKAREHISSSKGRSSHYSLIKISKIYLFDKLNTPKMYDPYRQIFNETFYISFGYP